MMKKEAWKTRKKKDTFSLDPALAPQRFAGRATRESPFFVRLSACLRK
jgi:hypothetical protein